MDNGATILCSVHRTSWVRPEDKWMRRMAPRMSTSRTSYSVFAPNDGERIGTASTYREAVTIANAAK